MLATHIMLLLDTQHSAHFLILHNIFHLKFKLLHMYSCNTVTCSGIQRQFYSSSSAEISTSMAIFLMYNTQLECWFVLCHGIVDACCIIASIVVHCQSLIRCSSQHISMVMLINTFQPMLSSFPICLQISPAHSYNCMYSGVIHTALSLEH